MPRQPTVRVGGVYLPHPRSAYGPRETVNDATTGQARRRRVLLEQATPALVWEMVQLGVEISRQAGGIGQPGRILYRCPQCLHRRTALYHVRPTPPGERSIQCRVCAHLIYASQRELRRAEADPDRLSLLLQRADAERAQHHPRRARQYRQKLECALAVREARTTEWTAARDLALEHIAARLARATDTPDV